MGLYTHAFRPVLFAATHGDAEQAHRAALVALRALGLSPFRQLFRYFLDVQNETEVCGIRFPNPVGLAAGFDKNAVALSGIAALGFGFAEIGAVTPLPQPGNPHPRLFRLAEDEAVINRYGFNNDGLEAIAARLARKGALGIPVGVNVGKGKTTPLENAADDYMAVIRATYPHADYFTVNISSPNTPDLRRLQKKEFLEKLLKMVRACVDECAAGGAPKPLFLKLAPDFDENDLDETLTAADGLVSGLILANTTVARPVSLRSMHKDEIGGLSGKPVREQALAMVRTVRRKLPRMPIIGAGGIASPDDARAMFDAGANLIQLYTGLVFEGPFLPHRINRMLKKTTRAD